MPDVLQPAYVLHSRRFRESSLIVELLTRDHGRQGVLAKGALGGKGGRQSLLQPFVPLLVDWRGRGELPTLTTLEAAGAGIQPSGRALYCGLYVNELVLRFSERGDPHSELFPAYLQCMNALLRAGEDNAELEPVLRRFELQLLDEMGLAMQLQEDQQGQPLQPGERYHYEIHAGPRIAMASEEGVLGATLRALAAGELHDPAQRREARSLMRRVIAEHLGGQQLKSRELFR